MLGLVGGLSLVLYAMRKDAPNHERVPVMSAVREPWEDEGEEWLGIGPEDTGAPNYTYPPPTAARFGFGSKKNYGCPRCDAKNVQRAKAKLPPLKPPFKYRSKDGAVFCFYCDEAMYPMSESRLIEYDPRYHSDPPADKAA